MMMTKRTFAAAALAMAAAALPGAAQQQSPLTQVMTCIKVLPGKAAEFAEVSAIAAKMYKARVDAGKLRSWTQLRSEFPRGSEARCDYMSSSIYEGAPPPPPSRADTEKALRDGGANMTVAEYFAKRDAVSRRVSTEMWRIRELAGALAKGHYVSLNYMKVHDAADYAEFEHSVWRPMADTMVKEGAMSSWVFATKMYPSGTETAYAAYSADVFPTWEAAMRPRNNQAAFEKAHPGKNYQQTMTRLGKLRELAQRQLFVVADRVSK